MNIVRLQVIKQTLDIFWDIFSVIGFYVILMKKYYNNISL